MHPYRVIVHTDRWSDDIYKIPNDPINLNNKSTGTNDAPRDPLIGPITRNPALTRGDMVYDYAYAYVYGIDISVDIVIGTIMLLHIYSTHCPCQLSRAIIVIGIGNFFLDTVPT